jgi:V/A-type H+-transporting ATPase subunit I
MDRVLVVGTKDVMEPTINALHEMNLLHVEDYIEEEEYFQIGKPLKAASSLSEKLLKLRSIKSYLGTKEKVPVMEKRDQILKDLEASLKTLEQGVTQKTSEKSALESQLKDLNHRGELLKPYEALGLPLEMLSGYETVAVFTGTVAGDIEPSVKGITGDYELFSAPYGKGQLIALYVPKAVAAQASDVLIKNGFVEIEPLREKGEPAVIRKSIDQARSQAEARLKAVNAEMAGFNEKYARFIMSSEELLTIDTQKAEAPLRFATSDNTFVVDGWVPVVDYEKLRAGLAEATGGRVYITKTEPEHKRYAGEVETHAHTEHHEVNAPVKYNNPKYMYPQQAFIDLYSRPKYDELDPTALFFVGFPIFYGFILGDIGYGALLLVLGIVLNRMLKHSEGFQILTKMLMICAASSIIFGVLFGEFLGFTLASEHIAPDGHITYDLLYNFYPHAVHIGPVGPFSLPVERLVPGGFPEHLASEHGGGDHGAVAEAPMSYVFGIKDLLVFTCIVGVVHLAIGYLLGMRNEARQHGLKTAIMHKGSWLLLLLGGVALVWYVFPLVIAGTMGQINPVDPLFLAGAVMSVLGIILLLMGEGFIAVLEIPGLMSNILSYTRLLAVGLSSVGIAFAVNKIVSMLMPADMSALTLLGALGLVAGLLVFLVGHTVNLVLGIIAPGLHSLRLHYVEFFQKFYKGGGRIYDPFGYKRKYTEE